MEIAALRASGARVFVLTAGNRTGLEIAAVFVAALPRIIRILPGPFLARITTAGQVTRTQFNR